MNENPTCQCFLNPFPWPVINPTNFPWMSSPTDGINQSITHITNFWPETGLTEDEKEVLIHLLNAWNSFTRLEAKHPDDNNEFKDAIHRAQEKIALRVARRINPEIWKTYGPTAGREYNNEK